MSGLGLESHEYGISNSLHFVHQELHRIHSSSSLDVSLLVNQAFLTVAISELDVILRLLSHMLSGSAGPCFLIYLQQY